MSEIKNKKTLTYIKLEDVKCPICNGNVNTKWFNFRSQSVVEFIAECWTPINPDLPRHIFYFQIKTPPCVLFDKDGKQITDEIKSEQK